ncbi:GntR family transcriptional regulator [Microbacterium sp.]|uniref:GntR family transcriptional regulator n=1 Tax=Microbacterium sp. TaxID=51671 RepID=UPI0032216459
MPTHPRQTPERFESRALRARRRQETFTESAPAPAYIAEQVKRLILGGELELGAPVTERWLTDRFAASRTTVREALSLLVAEHYLDQEPYRSARVRAYSSDEVRDILQSRMLIEGFAADNCAQASEDDRAGLQRAFADYASSVTAGQHDAAAMAHVQLHVAIVGLTGNKMLARLEHELMIGSLLLVDIINWNLQDSEKMYLEHLRLVNALLEPDPVKARALSDAHVGMVLHAANERIA